MHVRDGSGSGGIVSQMKASIESKSKAKAAGGNPSSAAVPNSTKQKINVSLALRWIGVYVRCGMNEWCVRVCVSMRERACKRLNFGTPAAACADIPIVLSCGISDGFGFGVGAGSTRCSKHSPSAPAVTRWRPSSPGSRIPRWLAASGSTRYVMERNGCSLGTSHGYRGG